MASLRTQHTSKIGVAPPPLKTPRGQIHSRKMGLPVRYRHLIERDLICLVELDHNIRTYRLHPETIKVPQLGAKPKSHTFTMLVESETTGPTMVDIIYRDPDEDLIQFVRALCHRRGQRYVAVPAAQVVSEPRLSNAKMIMHHGGITLPKAAVLAVRKAMSQGVTTVGQLENVLGDLLDLDLLPRQLVLAATASGLIRIDIGQPLSADAPVWL